MTKQGMREIFWEEAKFGWLIELHENFVALANIFFVHSDSLKQLVLQLLKNSDSAEQLFIFLFFSYKFLLYLINADDQIS